MKKMISNKLDWFKWFFTIMMVAYHSRSVWGINMIFKNSFENRIFNLYVTFSDHVGFTCMVFFFFVAGLLLFNGINGSTSAINKIKRRLKSLLVPILLWNTFVLIYKIFVEGFTFQIKDIFNYYFFAPCAGPLWFMWGLLILMFIALIISFIKNKKVGSVILVLLFVVSSTRNILINTNVIKPLLVFDNWWWFNNLLSYLPFYLLGSCVGYICPKLVLENDYSSIKFKIIGILVFIINSYICYKYYYSFWIFIYAFIDIIALWLIFSPKLFKGKVFKFLNTNIYILAIQNAILIPKANEWLNLVFGSISNIYVLLLFKTLILLIIILVCHILKMFCKFVFSNKIYEGLSGGR